MMELLERDIRADGRQSSKGNQYKWFHDNKWYKADYTGYEGLAEYTVSKLLAYSSLQEDEYVDYATEQIRYGDVIYPGCGSDNFLKQNWNLITLERLFQSVYGNSLNKEIYTIKDHKSRLAFIVEQTESATGLRDFGVYLCKLLTIDAFFLNEDRHTHNIAVLLDENGVYHCCPAFDHGAALLSDTSLDYPLGSAIDKLLSKAKPKTFCADFDEQLDIAEELYGQQIWFSFGRKEVENILWQEPYYPKETKERVQEIIMSQRRKYQYLFSSAT